MIKIIDGNKTITIDDAKILFIPTYIETGHLDLRAVRFTIECSGFLYTEVLKCTVFSKILKKINNFKKKFKFIRKIG